MKISWSLATALFAATTIVAASELPIPFDTQSSVELFANTNKPIPGSSPVNICDVDSKQVLDIKYLKIDPNPPKRGEELYIEGEGYLSDTITQGAFVEVEVKYGFIRLVKETLDLCEQLEKAEKPCPLEKGVINFAKSVELPNEIPAGKYNVVARAYKEDYTEIACLTAQVEFSRS
ncbi:ML domain-containing protein [Dipodascopsis uninucleata]